MEEDKRLVAVYVANLDVNRSVDKGMSIQFGPGKSDGGECGWDMRGIRERIREVVSEALNGEAAIYWGVDQARFPTMTTIVKLGGDNWGITKGREKHPWQILNMTMDEVLGILREDMKNAGHGDGSSDPVG